MTRRRLTGVQVAWLVTAALLTAWYGPWGAIAATVRWPGLTFLISAFAFLAHRSTTQTQPTLARKKAH
jgi:Mg2+/Co2+ transporter CorB